MSASSRANFNFLIYSGTFNGHEWEALYSMLLLVRRAVTYFLDDIGMLPFGEMDPTVPGRRTVMSPTNVAHLRQLVLKHNIPLGRYYGVPMTHVIYCATDLLLLFRFSNTALSCIFQENYLRVVTNWISAMLTDRSEMRNALVELITVAALSSHDLSDYITRSGVVTQVRFLSRYFDQASTAVSALAFDPRSRESFFQLTPICSSYRTRVGRFPHPLPIASPISEEPAAPSTTAKAPSTSDLDIPTSLFRHKPNQSGTYQLWMRYSSIEYQLEMDTGIMELEIDGLRIGGKGCNTLRGGFKVLNLLPEEDIAKDDPLRFLRSLVGSHYVAIEYENPAPHCLAPNSIPLRLFWRYHPID